MNKQQKNRIEQIAPGGIPRWIRVYDNGGTDAPGGSIDRYTVIFTGRLRAKAGGVPHLAMNEAPFYPQGFCQHMTYDCACDTYDGKWAPAIGRKCHLGRRILFVNLNTDCQKAVWQDYADYWDIPNQMA
jgi:hypothetical protein